MPTKTANPLPPFERREQKPSLRYNGDLKVAAPFMRILLASSNPGKLREYQAMAAGRAIEFALLPNFSSLPAFDESAPTFAENAAGKALHYSRFATDAVIADDSGLVVPALGGAPGVNSARYAGPTATDAQRIAKLLADLRAVGAGPKIGRAHV